MLTFTSSIWLASLPREVLLQEGPNAGVMCTTASHSVSDTFTGVALLGLAGVGVVTGSAHAALLSQASTTGTALLVSVGGDAAKLVGALVLVLVSLSAWVAETVCNNCRYSSSSSSKGYKQLGHGCL